MNENQQPDQRLIDKALEQILRDVDYKDLTALEELLKSVPRAALLGYLPENTGA